MTLYAVYNQEIWHIYGKIHILEDLEKINSVSYLEIRLFLNPRGGEKFSTSQKLNVS